MRFAHAAPFGAEVREEGVRFRLWAPGARSVELLLEDATPPRAIAMTALDDGLYETTEQGAAPGTRYRYRIDGTHVVPDPASRSQSDDVHGPSVVVDPTSYRWRRPDWRGRPWHEAVLYEVHVGTFSPEGTFDGVRARLDHLVDLGVTAIQLMPIADFSGRRNWGYDGVLLYAPAAAYGTPDELKRLVDAAHERGVMMLLDVVYNHFGPDGNYLHLYAPQFFTERFETPWGAAIDYARPEVRDFVVHNALHWLQEYRFDGLRLDAVHEIIDDGPVHLLDELARRVHGQVGDDRHVHLVLENEHNDPRRLERGADGVPETYTAQWNDDVHHALHVLATGERRAYYAAYAERPLEHLARCLSEGFAFQGEPYAPRDAAPRGSRSAHLPPGAFVAFAQNHDQIGNRAHGERLATLADPRVLKTLGAVLLLAPSPPMLFMGEEWGAREPFLFFCDFHDELADAVREGRRKEFAAFPAFRDEEARAAIPDPNDVTTFERSRLDWERRARPEHAAWLDHHRELLAIRHREIAPRIPHIRAGATVAERVGAGGLVVRWRLEDGSELSLRANLSHEPWRDVPDEWSDRRIFVSDGAADALANGALPAWSVVWSVTP